MFLVCIGLEGVDVIWLLGVLLGGDDVFLLFWSNFFVGWVCWWGLLGVRFESRNEEGW